MQRPTPLEASAMSRADIVAAIRNAGYTLKALAEANDLSPAAISVALSKKWPKVERIIANVIGIPPQKIWPPRYPSEGLPIKRGETKESRGTIRGTVHSGARASSKRRAA